MKKNQQPRNKAQKPQYDDFSSLNSELGSFGLEPPKHYREVPTTQKRQAPKRKQPQSKKNVQKKKRKASKLVKKIISIICIIIAILVILVVLSLTVFFKIEKINIVDNKQYTVNQIEAVLPIEKQKNLFLIDTKGATKKLEEKLPYIYDVKITRKLPSTVNVKITETPQVYSVTNKDKTYTLLDDNFKVLESNAEKKPKNCIEIKELGLTSTVIGQTATVDKEKKLNNLNEIIRVIKELKLGETTAIYSKDVNNNFIVYDNRITIKLGTVENIDAKVYSALTAIDRLNQSDPNVEGVLTATDDKQIYFTDK